MATRDAVYTIKQLDGRFSYREWFHYFLSFSGTMYRKQGPWHFCQAQKWFTTTYGWSAEVRQYSELHRWDQMRSQMTTFAGFQPAYYDMDITQVCNPYWSWSTQHSDLRIYIKSDKELTFWQLSQPF